MTERDLGARPVEANADEMTTPEAAIRRLNAVFGSKQQLRKPDILDADRHPIAPIGGIAGLYIGPRVRVLSLSPRVVRPESTEPVRAAFITGTLLERVEHTSGSLLRNMRPHDGDRHLGEYLIGIERAFPAPLVIEHVLQDCRVLEAQWAPEWLTCAPATMLCRVSASVSWFDYVRRLLARLAEQDIEQGHTRVDSRVDAALHAYLAGLEHMQEPLIWFGGAGRTDEYQNLPAPSEKNGAS